MRPIDTSTVGRRLACKEGCNSVSPPAPADDSRFSTTMTTPPTTRRELQFETSTARSVMLAWVNTGLLFSLVILGIFGLVSPRSTGVSRDEAAVREERKQLAESIADLAQQINRLLDKIGAAHELEALPPGPGRVALD